MPIVVAQQTITEQDPLALGGEDEGTDPISGDYTGYSWDQTHVDTQWLIDAPELSQVMSTQNMFREAASINVDIGHWDMSNVTYMADMFRGAASFNRFIGNWDVSNVADMSRMFQGVDSFSGGINRWDTGNVNEMTGMFSDAGSIISKIFKAVSQIDYCFDRINPK